MEEMLKRFLMNLLILEMFNSLEYLIDSFEPGNKKLFDIDDPHKLNVKIEFY